MVSIIFDLGNTLKKDMSHKEIEKVIKYCLFKEGISEEIYCEYEQLLVKRLSMINKNLSIKITANELLDEILNNKSLSNRLYTTISDILSRSFEWSKDLEKQLTTLKLQGVKLYVLSNTIWDSTFYIENNKKIFSKFDGLYFSDKTGLRKPSISAFINVIENENIFIKDTWMIGDSCDNDISPAQALGLRTIQITDSTTEKEYNRVKDITEALEIVRKEDRL